jgi:LPXTG-motif cell wall-anchored protein
LCEQGVGKETKMRGFRMHGVLGGAAVATAVAAAFALNAPTALAHSYNVEDSCEGLRIDFDLYDGGDDNNRLEVTIDGSTQTLYFGKRVDRVFSWSPSASHAWSVTLDANLNEGDSDLYDMAVSGSRQACVTTSTTVPDTTSTTSTTVPDTTSTTSTTVPDTTSTTVAVTVTEPPTTPAPTTAVDVQVAPPLPGVTPAPPSVDPPVVPATLPTTGGNTNGIAVAGALLLAAGALSLFAARRQRQHG